MRHVLRWIAWWAVLLVTWLVLTATLDPAEVLAGAAAGAIGATAAAVVAAQGLIRFRPRLRWLVRAWSLPIQAVAASGRVFAALWRHLVLGRPLTGVFRAIPFDAGDPESARDAARNTLVKEAISFSPNSIAVGAVREENVLLVHELVPTARTVEELLSVGGGGRRS